MEKFHFIGIKGSGMSALAQVLHDLGHYVQGSDVDTYFFTQKKLEDRNIKILTHSKENIEEGFTVVLGNAFNSEHEEYIRAKELGLTIHTYSELLGILSEKIKSVAVTGAHGKTTTTTMGTTVFKDNIGTAYLIGDGSGASVRDPEMFVFEACEYRRHFLKYKPNFAIVTNIDFDHPDYFSDERDVFDAFQSLADQVKEAVVYCGDDRLASELTSKTAKLISYGFNDGNDYQIKNLKADSTGSNFDIYKEGSLLGNFQMPIFGLHEVSNAAAVIAVGDLAGLKADDMRKSVLTYQKAARRYTEHQHKDNIIVDDYAHHPREIVATLDTSRRKYADKDVVAVFQPHTFTRTEALLEEFAEALEGADKIYLYPIFGSAREDKGNVSIEDLAKAIKKPVELITGEENFESLASFENTVLLFMGAGDINKYQEKFLEYLSTK